MIKISIEGETPLATLADLVATAHYFAGSPEVSAAARNVIAADEKSLGAMARRETNSVEVVNLGAQPRHHAPDPDNAGQHIFITQREENQSGAAAQNPTPPQNGYSGAAAQNPAPAQNGYSGAAAQNPAPAQNGYSGTATQNPTPPQNGYSGAAAAQNPTTPQNGYGYPATGAQGGAQGNPTAGAFGRTMKTTTTSPSNAQQQRIPGMAPVAGTAPGAGPIPVSAAPGFTIGQLGRAGADLVTANPAKRAELNALLQQYGVQTIVELRPEQVGTFAQALRGMGARI